MQRYVISKVDDQNEAYWSTLARTWGVGRLPDSRMVGWCLQLHCVLQQQFCTTNYKKVPNRSKGKGPWGRMAWRRMDVRIYLLWPPTRCLTFGSLWVTYCLQYFYTLNHKEILITEILHIVMIKCNYSTSRVRKSVMYSSLFVRCRTGWVSSRIRHLWWIHFRHQ